MIIAMLYPETTLMKYTLWLDKLKFIIATVKNLITKT